MPDLPLPDSDGTSLVLVGAFNPRIFHPAWFVRNNLLPEGTEVAANVEIVNNNLCAFETEWFRLEVLSDRLLLHSTATPAVEALRDLLLGALRILRHTPVQKAGLNTHAHFHLPSEKSWHDFGHLLAPKDVLWDPILEKPGTLSLGVEGLRTDGYEGHIRVKVEPSARIANGVFIETNDEYRKPDADSAQWLDDVLTKEWENSRQRALNIREHLMTHAFGGQHAN